jgi:hypothetical protein
MSAPTILGTSHLRETCDHSRAKGYSETSFANGSALSSAVRTILLRADWRRTGEIVLAGGVVDDDVHLRDEAGCQGPSTETILRLPLTKLIVS